MKFWGALAAFLAGLAGFWRSMFAARKSGERKERVKHLEEKVERQGKENEVQKEMLEAGANRPDPDGVRKRLRDGSA